MVGGGGTSFIKYLYFMEIFLYLPTAYEVFCITEIYVAEWRDFLLGMSGRQYSNSRKSGYIITAYFDYVYFGFTSIAFHLGVKSGSSMCKLHALQVICITCV